MLGIAGIAAAGGGSSFNPTSIAGIALWLRADLGVTLSGSDVTSWNDQSGTGDTNKNLTSGAPTATFTASDSNYGGKPSIVIASGQSMAATGAWASSIADPYTVYVTGKATGSASTELINMNGANGLGDNGGSNNWIVKCGAFLPGPTASVALCTTPAVIAFIGTANGGLYVSNSQTADGNVGGSGAATAIPQIGLSDAVETGSVAEIIIYSGAHDAATRQTIMKYMGSRYGLAAS